MKFRIPQIDIGHERYMSSLTDEQQHQPVSGNSQWGASLVIPLQRSHSTRSSVDDASSTGPPTFTPEVMCCDVGNCRQAFTGMYRRGNLGRHKRQKHREGQAYVCEDDTCAKEFQRKDARLKHYRRNHPELAADRPLVSSMATIRAEPTVSHGDYHMEHSVFLGEIRTPISDTPIPHFDLTGFAERLPDQNEVSRMATTRPERNENNQLSNLSGSEGGNSTESAVPMQRSFSPRRYSGSLAVPMVRRR